MTRGVRLYIAGSVVLVALAGCGRSWVQYQERDSWRHQAEVDCLKTGAVKVGSSVVRMEPIAGPGMCGADFPLKVAALGVSSSLGFTDDVRPPGAIPNASAAQTPRWPIAESRITPPSEIRTVPSAPARYAPPPVTQAYEPRSVPGRPMSINPPGMMQGVEEDDIPDDTVLPPGRNAAPQSRPLSPPPRQAYPEQRSAPPALGPQRAPFTGSVPAAAITPTATLACPIVSALDQWVATSVQPSAMRWFRQPVVEIKQISAYSCRGMVGAGTSRISEHAFGNALDIAAFVLADGRKITVKTGWDGTPEEAGFLHDVQLAACDQFTTVLAPGYNAAHYDHIHVDLMRRDSGRRACKPYAMSGEVAAAKQMQKTKFARRGSDPMPTGAIAGKPAKGGDKSAQNSTPGEDGYFADDDDEPGETTGSIPEASAKPAPKGKALKVSKQQAKEIFAKPAPAMKAAVPGDDGDFDEDD